jgi:putative membrane protein
MRQVVELAKEQTTLSQERTRQSAQRSEMSAERSYMNAERTLSVWIRTALAAMVVGIAIDRFGLTVAHPRPGIGPDTASTWVGAALVGFGIVIAVVTGVRFRRYAADYCQSHVLPRHHGPFMGPAFALVASLFGVVLLVLLLVTH